MPSEETVGIAAISLKEAAWHLARERLVVDESFGPWPLWLRAAASASFLLTVDVAIESEYLGESFPPDPADRLIVATARAHDLTHALVRVLSAPVATPGTLPDPCRGQ